MGLVHKNTATGAGVTNPPASSAETVIYTTPAIMAGVGAPTVAIAGTINITPGTGCTAIVIRVRQTNLTGTQVGPTQTHTVAAGAPQSISFGVTDTSTFIESGAGAVYVVTVSATGATGAGTTNLVDIEVLV